MIYHISKQLQKGEKTFTPRVPSTLAISEDLKTPRICFSERISGCLNAMPNKQEIYEDFLKKGSTVLAVYSLDENTVSTEIPSRQQVIDGEDNLEIWVKEEVTLSPIFIKVTDLSFENGEITSLDFTVAESTKERELETTLSEKEVKEFCPEAEKLEEGLYLLPSDANATDLILEEDKRLEAEMEMFREDFDLDFESDSERLEMEMEMFQKDLDLDYLDL